MTQTTIEDSGAAQSPTTDAATPAASTSAASSTGDTPSSMTSATATSPSHRSTEHARSLIEKHPLGALAAGAALTAFFEVEFAVGLLTGIGVTALLATRTGAEARREALNKSKHLLGIKRLLGFMRGSSTRRKDAGTPEASPPSPPSPPS